MSVTFTMRPYDGSSSAPFPPMPGCWSVVGWHDHVAMARALELASQMPLWHYADEVTPHGCYRYFCVQAEDGTQGVCALKMRPAGTPGTLGDAAAGDGSSGPSSGDGGATDTSGTAVATPGTNIGAASTDTTQGATDTTQVIGEAPSTGGGGGGGPVSPSQPVAPTPAPTVVPTTGTTSSSSSSTPLVLAGLAALALGGVIVVGAAQKKKGHGAHVRM